MDRPQILQLAAVLNSATDAEQTANIRLQCPLAPFTHEKGTDRNPAWAVLVSSDAPSVSRCWSCDHAGTVIQILEQAKGLGVSGLDDAIAYVRENDKGGLAGAFAGLRARNMRAEADAKRGQGFDVERYVRKAARTTSSYVLQRGLVRRDLERWRIGYDAGPTRIGYTTIRHRVVFPVWDERGELVGATLRTVMPPGVDPPKYWDTPGLPKREVFYGEHLVDPTRDEVYLVEGILDAVVASRYLPNVVALLGAKTGILPTRLEKLRRWADRVTLILDSDRAGDEAISGRWVDVKRPDGTVGRRFKPGILQALRPYLVVRVAHLPPGQDPADLGAEVVDYARRATYLDVTPA